MPTPPVNPIGEPQKYIENVPFAAVGTAGNDLTTEVLVVAHTGYVTAARLIPAGAAAFNASNFRTWSIVDASTISLTDGCIVSAASMLGPWSVATAYVAGNAVTLNNLMYVCILSVTGGTGPGVDTSHWQQIAALGLGWVNTLSTRVSSDQIGAAISDSGNTNIPASSLVGAVVTVAAATAIALVNVAPVIGNPPQSATGPVVQAGPTVLNQVNGTAVVTRTVTVESSRTLATFSCNAVSLAAGVETDLVVSTTDSKAYRSDVLTMTSVHQGTGVADPGGTLQIELTSYEEGTG